MRVAIPGAAIAALLCTATLALAQGQQDRPDRGGRDRGERAAPHRGGGAGGTQDRASPRVEMRDRVEQRSQRNEGPQRGTAERRIDRSPDRDRVREGDVGRRARQQSQTRDRAETSRERLKQNTHRRQVERKEVERRQVERPERAERRTERPAGVQERRDERAGQRADRSGRVAERREAAREARARLTTEQRARFYSSFDRRRVTNVHFRARVGTRIPRSVRLYAIPAAVLGFAPAYSSYSYVYVDDTICIVDPDTYEIVDVIEYGSGGPDVLEAQLDLTDWEKALILDSIAADFPEAEIELRLALGAEVPGPVELHTFPDVVLDRIQKVRAYRFVVSDGDVVIVDPSDREIEMVVRR